jgi:hypothetical protein
MKTKLNWGFIIAMICLIAFWIFAIYVIVHLIELKGSVSIYKADQKYQDVIRLKSQAFKIAMFKEEEKKHEAYWCPVDSETCNTIVDIANEYGVDGQVIINLGWCESRLRPIYGVIDNRDRGIFQINNFWHPEISDECAFDLKCSAHFTAEMISRGRGYEWYCF